MRSLLCPALLALLLMQPGPVYGEDLPPAPEAPAEPAPEPEPTPKPAPKADPKNVLTYGAITQTGFSPSLESRIKDAVKQRDRHFRFCHEKALKTAPTTTGKVVLGVEVGQRGDAMSVNVSEDTTGNADIARCLTQRARRLRFPPPDSTGQVTITLVFTVE